MCIFPSWLHRGEKLRSRLERLASVGDHGCNKALTALLCVRQALMADLEEIDSPDDLTPSNEGTEVPYCFACGRLWVSPYCLKEFLAGVQHTDLRFTPLRALVEAAFGVEVFLMLSQHNRCPECRERPRCLQAPCYYDNGHGTPTSGRLLSAKPLKRKS
jgi:hypothetical protein